MYILTFCCKTFLPRVTKCILYQNNFYMRNKFIFLSQAILIVFNISKTATNPKCTNFNFILT